MAQLPMLRSHRAAAGGGTPLLWTPGVFHGNVGTSQQHPLAEAPCNVTHMHRQASRSRWVQARRLLAARMGAHPSLSCHNTRFALREGAENRRRDFICDIPSFCMFRLCPCLGRPLDGPSLPAYLHKEAFAHHGCHRISEGGIRRAGSGQAERDSRARQPLCRGGSRCSRQEAVGPRG